MRPIATSLSLPPLQARAQTLLGTVTRHTAHTPGGLKSMDFQPPQCGSARAHRAPSHRTVAPSHRHASSDWGADVARQGNSAQCTYVRTPKIHGVPSATVVWRANAHRTVAPSHRARRLEINDSPAHSGVAGARAPHRCTVAPRQEALNQWFSSRHRSRRILDYSAVTRATTFGPQNNRLFCGDQGCHCWSAELSIILRGQGCHVWSAE